MTRKLRPTSRLVDGPFPSLSSLRVFSPSSLRGPLRQGPPRRWRRELPKVAKEARIRHRLWLLPASRANQGSPVRGKASTALSEKPRPPQRVQTNALPALPNLRTTWPRGSGTRCKGCQEDKTIAEVPAERAEQLTHPNDRLAAIFAPPLRHRDTGMCEGPHARPTCQPACGRTTPKAAHRRSWSELATKGGS